MTDNYLRRAEAADFLRARFGLFTKRTLAKMACTGGGPIYRKLGRIPIYKSDDLIKWAEARLSDPVCNTSQLPRAKTEEAA